MKKVILAVSLCATSALFAGQSDYRWEFTPTIGGTTVLSGDIKEDFKSNNLFFGGRLAVNLDNYAIDQIELAIDKTKFRAKNGVDNTSMMTYGLNLVKNFNSNSDTIFYGLLGAGYADYKDGDDDGAYAQLGLGLKHYWSDNFATKIEVRDAYHFRPKANLLSYSLGFAVDFGKKYAVAAPVAGIADSDGDGVPDNIDRCPNTPAGVVVDEFGCEKVVRINLGVNFKFDSAEVNEKYLPELAQVADFLRENPTYTVLLEGNTDSVGAAAYNQKLSEKRALAVSKVLIRNGVDAAKIRTVGLGETNPIATNKTADGRAQNRRVDAKFRK